MNHGSVTPEFYERSWGLFSCNASASFSLHFPIGHIQTHPFLKLSIVIQIENCDWRSDVIAEP